MLNGAAIRKAREKVGESQAAFALRFGVDQSTVSDWERDGPPSRGAARRAIELEIGQIRPKKRVSRETSVRT